VTLSDLSKPAEIIVRPAPGSDSGLLGALAVARAALGSP